MNILIIGSGGREHALAWKASQSKMAGRVYVAPGNAGTELEANLINVAIDVTDIEKLVQFAQTNAVGLTIVGPEVPLVLGIVDSFENAGLKCFGPSKKAAQLEGSKTFSKQFLEKYAIPTAEYESFTDPKLAISYIQEKGTPIVIKADGLAAGKGVVIAHSETEAITAVNDMLGQHRYGEAGNRIIVEEFLQGEEASFIVIADGKNAIPMATSQDHKPRDNNNKGPNTGGMGAYSPAPVVTQTIHENIMREIIYPSIQGLSNEGVPYVGFLYAGLMIDQSGKAKVLEFNCRLGDPETQPIMMRLQSDLVEFCLNAVDQNLEGQSLDWDKRSALGVVMAASGYPDQYKTGQTITGIPESSESSKVFHAGTQLTNGHVKTAGGRVLCACALGENITAAQQKAYKSVSNISWDGAFFRTDIGYQAISREI